MHAWDFLKVILVSQILNKISVKELKFEKDLTQGGIKVHTVIFCIMI